MMNFPPEWDSLFSLGELKPILVFQEQVNVPLNFDSNGSPKTEKIKSLVKEIDLGLWDAYLTWNYEAYQNAKNQIKMGELFSNLSTNPQSINSMGQSNPTDVKEQSQT